jgi:transposase-like protein
LTNPIFAIQTIKKHIVMKKAEKAWAGYVQMASAEKQSIINHLSRQIDSSDEISLNRRDTLHCPNCKSRKFFGIGKQKGVQRFKCKECTRCFSETTGRFIYCLKKKESVKPYLHCILSGFSIRKSASICGISKHTSLVWRHKILLALEKIANPNLTQIVEGISIEEPYSKKGQIVEKIDKKHSEKNRHALDSNDNSDSKTNKKLIKKGVKQQIPIGLLLLRDRDGNTSMKVVCRGKVGKRDLERILSEKLSGVEVICSPANRSFTAYIRDKGVVHYKRRISKIKGKKVIKKREGVRKAEAGYQLNNVLDYVLSWRQFMERFRGVATKYLQNYLNWYILLDKLKFSQIQFKQTEDILWQADGSWYQYKKGIFNTDFRT